VLRDTTNGTGRPGTAPSAAGLGRDKPLGQDTSTGNKHLDLLLELQGKPGDDLKAPLPRAAASSSAAAASAAASALAALRKKAAERPPDDDERPKPRPQPFDGIGTLEVDARSAEPAERRQWSGGLAGAAGGGVSQGYSDDTRESRSDREDRVDSSLLRRLRSELIAFFRENGYWLLGGLAAIAAVGAAIKGYSRRV
jgi:hypothetical protein